MSKEKVSKWSLVGSILSLLGQKDGKKISSIDLAVLWPDFTELPIWDKFLRQYAVKQITSDRCSALQGSAKLDGIKGNLSEEWLKGLTFDRSSGGGGTSYKKAAEEAQLENMTLLRGIAAAGYRMKDRDKFLESFKPEQAEAVRAIWIEMEKEDPKKK